MRKPKNAKDDDKDDDKKDGEKDGGDKKTAA